MRSPRTLEFSIWRDDARNEVLEGGLAPEGGPDEAPLYAGCGDARASHDGGSAPSFHLWSNLRHHTSHVNHTCVM